MEPIKVVENPPHSGLQTLFKGVAGLLPELVWDQRGVDRIAAVVTGAVAHQGDQAPLGSAFRMQLIHQGADRFHHLAVITFSAAFYPVTGAESAACC